MPFSDLELSIRWPYLYHLTDIANIHQIRQTGNLIPAAHLLAAAGMSDHIRTRRKSSLPITVAGEEVWLCDQAKLSFACIEFLDGLDANDLVEMLNQRVFFWPGNEQGPIKHGLRHFSKYSSGTPAVLRVDTQALVNANPASSLFFCAYNSGSPRFSGGKKSPRGKQTFSTAQEFSRSISAVVEVTIAERVILPFETDVAESYGGQWKRLSSGSMNPRPIDYCS